MALWRRRRVAGSYGIIFHQLRQREDVAPYLPRGSNLLGIGAYAQWNVQRGIAMNQHQHLRVVETAQRDAEKVAGRGR